MAVGVFAVLSAAAAIIDMKRFLIPDTVNIAIFIAGIAVSFLVGAVTPLSALIGAVVGGMSVWAIQAAFRMWRGYDGLGLGDVKFVAAAGTWTGIEGFALALVIASAAALIYVMCRRVVNRGFDATQPIPFCPALSLGFFAIAAAQLLGGMPVLDMTLAH
ncbi:MAG: prepilin peptidase [Hyphomicrobiales bacterium]|nr:prepilin peptidase [Hyphomicrobiales bacterium]